jgi:hypothetical protein
VNTQAAIGVVYLRRHISWLSVTSAVMTSSWLIANQGHPFPIFHSLLNSYFSAREVEFALTKHPRRQNDRDPCFIMGLCHQVICAPCFGTSSCHRVTLAPA